MISASIKIFSRIVFLLFVLPLTILLLSIPFLRLINWLSTFEDRSFESMLIEKLTSSKEVKIEEIIPIGEQVCFLPSYVTPDSVDPHLSNNQMNFLNDKISDDIGDHVWWIIILSKEEVLKIYEMSSYLRSDFRKGRCVKRKNSKFIFSGDDGFTTFFDLSEGM
ncbi:hypothetical protein [Verminephrobacter aporrectodeae]|uniref:hypothetical protein n=1 Tax=Verminephrobacter aporrectodeae TaxID=1110389 RepID=UPI0022374D92|nr:hypothetical protein [Verminephrobacter aporrectodeae]